MLFSSKYIELFLFDVFIISLILIFMVIFKWWYSTNCNDFFQTHLLKSFLCVNYCCFCFIPWQNTLIKTIHFLWSVSLLWHIFLIYRLTNHIKDMIYYMIPLNMELFCNKVKKCAIYLIDYNFVLNTLSKFERYKCQEWLTNVTKWFFYCQSFLTFIVQPRMSCNH